MQNALDTRWRLPVLAACVAALCSAAAGAQVPGGSARAVQATVQSSNGLSTTVLADTGSLGGATDAREAGALTAAIPSLVSGETLHATTIGWDDQVQSEASIAGLTVTINGTTITADLVLARALSTGSGRNDLASVSINGLAIDGVPVAVSGSANQRITFASGEIVINERPQSAGAVSVNGLHIVADGGDIIIASATARAQ